jgi:two-component system, OmpR family, sensor histidine kinase KdpD
LDNAIKFSTHDKAIAIAITQDAQEIFVSIRDHGKGIPTDEMVKVFDKFYRTKSAGNITGSGLGLSICKGIIQAHHGRIWAEDNPPQGTTIWFTLPLHPEENQ